MNIENLTLNTIPCTIIAEIKPTVRIPQFVIYANDPNKPNTVYYNRIVTLDPKTAINGVCTFDLKLPIAPKLLTVSMFNYSNGNLRSPNADGTFKLTKFEPCELKTNPLWLTDKDKEFMLFIKQFANNATVLDYGKNGKPAIYLSKNGNFTIEYFDILRNKKTGNAVSTPSRINEDTGIIQIGANFFNTYSVPSKVEIGLHEYWHVFKNPGIGKEKTNEIAADIGSLYYYLSEGFSESEAIKVFVKVFNNARMPNGQINPDNAKRMAIIHDFIYKFNQGQFNNATTDYIVKK